MAIIIIKINSSKNLSQNKKNKHYIPGLKNNKIFYVAELRTRQSWTANSREPDL